MVQGTSSCRDSGAVLTASGKSAAACKVPPGGFTGSAGSQRTDQSVAQVQVPSCNMPNKPFLFSCFFATGSVLEGGEAKACRAGAQTGVTRVPGKCIHPQTSS